MRCPYCFHSDTKVTDSREADDGIRRRREGLACGAKRAGRREESPGDRVRAGISRSCAKLPVGAAEIDAVVDDVEAALHARGGVEVPSSEIGALLMERLRELNHVAYVRFASHYRNFLSLEELQEEFARLAATPRRSPPRAGAAPPPPRPPTIVDTPSAPPRPPAP